jgi:hypothetical protein
VEYAYEEYCLLGCLANEFPESGGGRFFYNAGNIIPKEEAVKRFLHRCGTVVN